MRRWIWIGIFVATAAPGARAQTATGVVTAEDTGAPLEAASVALLSARRDVVRRVATDSGGRYVLRVPEPGAYIVVADHLGHLQLESPLASFVDEQTVTIDFELPVDAIELDGIRVEAERQADLRRRVGLYGVRPQELGLRWVDRDAIERRQTATDFGVALQWQAIPSLTVIRSEDAGGPPSVCARYRGGGCAMTVLNGQPVPLDAAAMVPPIAIEAIVFLTPSEATLSFGTEGGNGAVLLFTRTGAGRE